MTDRSPASAAATSSASASWRRRRSSPRAAGTAGRCSSRGSAPSAGSTTGWARRSCSRRRRLAPEYPVAARTPAANFPAYSITRNRTGSFPAPPGDGLGARGRRAGADAHAAHPAMIEALPARDLHGEAPLRRGMDRDRDLDRRAGLGRDATWCSRRRRRGTCASTRSTADYYNGWDLASAMHPQTILAYGFNDRPLTIEPRSAAPAVFAGQAGVQADEVPDRHDVHPGAAGRLLGGSGVSRGSVEFSLPAQSRPRPTPPPFRPRRYVTSTRQGRQQT